MSDSLLRRGRQPQAQMLRAEVVDVRHLTEDLFVLALSGFGADFHPQPGMFIHLRVNEEDHPLLRRPISIQTFEKGVAELLVRVVGAGTRILQRCRVGDQVNVLGPLGTTFAPIAAGERILLVGGGVGVAPLVGCCHRAAPGCSIDFCYGGRNSAEIQRFDWMEARTEEIRLHPSTDDGSLGHRGFCTDVAADLLSQNEYDRIYTCGPWIMMKKVAYLAQSRAVPFSASLEVQMGCGMGACLACVYRTQEGEFVRSCIDGPVVDGNEVVWEQEG